MIDHALSLTARRLNQKLGAQFSVSEDLVALAHLTDWEGKPNPETRNRLALFVTNIEDDQLARARSRDGGRTSGGLVQAAPAVHLDVSFMLAANFDAQNYTGGLKILSAAIRVFQSAPVLTHQTVPDMHPALNQLAFELVNLGNEAMGQLWGNLGGRYLPSVMYKMRSVRIDSGAIDKVLPVIEAPTSAAAPETAS
jgi:hypothetical protein